MMSAAHKLNQISVADYLTGEIESSVKHEYLNGCVYAMAGRRVTHNRIATNSTVALGIQLRGQPCQPYNSDMKIRVQLQEAIRFYYPDVSVVCDSNPAEDAYQDKPVVIVEVLSNDTRRIDETEKKEAYLSLPSLRVYLLVEQDSAKVTVHRRGDNQFNAEVFEGVDAFIPLPEIEVNLPLQEVYAGVKFSSQQSDILD